jgi:hypothetical protein
MNHQKRYGKLALLLAVLLCLWYPVPARAADQQEPLSLTIVDQQDGTPISNVTFRLYRVADIQEDGAFLETEDFQNTGVLVQPQDQDWGDQASTLEAHVVERTAEGTAIQPAASGATDSSGEMCLKVEQAGLYLLVGDQKTQGSTIYTTQAILLTLPYEEDDGSWNQAPTIYAKNNARENRNAPVECSVVKVWKDDGATAQRPKCITVTLYQNETAYETVTLSEDNSWRYTWKDLDNEADYHVVEQEIPTGYTVTTAQEGSTFVVTNTWTPSPSPSPSTPPASPTPPTTTSKLPQTGQLWWPVRLLAVAGLGLMLLGWGIRRREDEHET